MSRVIRLIIEDQEPLIVQRETTVSEAVRLMEKSHFGAVMVADNGKLAGIFTERDAVFKVMAKGLSADSTLMAEVMSPHPKCIHPDKPFVDALRIMHANGFRHVPVVENGRPIGMVSARDALGPELESFIYELLRQSRMDDIPTIPVRNDH